MQYALLIHQLPEGEAAIPDDDQPGITAEYFALREDPRVIGGAGLDGVHTATTMRSGSDGYVISDGPFADTKEVFAGFYLVDTDDLDSAMEIAKRIPAVRYGGSIEIRPVLHQPE